MVRASTRALGVLVGLAVAGGVSPIGGLGQRLHAQQSASATVPTSPSRATLDRYCVTCHNERLLTGGLALDIANVDDVSADADESCTICAVR